MDDKENKAAPARPGALPVLRQDARRWRARVIDVTRAAWRVDGFGKAQAAVRDFGRAARQRAASAPQYSLETMLAAAEMLAQLHDYRRARADRVSEQPSRRGSCAPVRVNQGAPAQNDACYKAFARHRNPFPQRG